MKVALTVAFLVVLPYVLYQVWAFVAPGLYAHEKKLAMPLLAASVILFFIGMAFAYFAFFPDGVRFHGEFCARGRGMDDQISRSTSPSSSPCSWPLASPSEVPVIVIVLVKIRVVNVAKHCASGGLMSLSEPLWWPRYLRHPDVISQFIDAVPLGLP